MNASIYNELPNIMLINANYIDYKITINKNPRQTSGVLTFGTSRNRTRDTRIFSPLLYQLS